MNSPSEWASPSGPWLILELRGASCDLFSSLGVVEKDLVTCAVRHDRRAVQSKVNVSDRAVVTLDSLHWLEVLLHIVENDLAIVGSDRTNRVVRREFDDLNGFSLGTPVLASLDVLERDSSLRISLVVEHLECSIDHANSYLGAVICNGNGVSRALELGVDLLPSVDHVPDSKHAVPAISDHLSLVWV